MDDKSIEILEFAEIRRIIAGYASFSIAGDLALNLKPLTDHDQVSLLLRQSAEARYLLSVDNSFTTSGAADIREAVSMAALGNILEPAQLIEIQQTLAVMRQVRSNLHSVSTEVPLLWDIAWDITELPGVEREITRCLSPSGEVLDRASPEELQRIYRVLLALMR